MPPYLAITCSRCEFRQRFITRRNREYELGDGSRISVFLQVAFCADCCGASDVEDFPDEEQIRQRIRNIRNGFEDEDIKYIDRTREDWAAYHEKVLRWRISRASPPRCLECGSMDIRAFIEQWKKPKVACPKCKIGVLHHSVQGLVTTTEHTTYIYNPEGDLLRVEEVVP